MEVMTFKRFHVTECAACGELFTAAVCDGMEGLEELRHKHKSHVEASKECKAWFDALPTFDDIRGLWADPMRDTDNEVQSWLDGLEGEIENE